MVIRVAVHVGVWSAGERKSSGEETEPLRAELEQSGCSEHRPAPALDGAAALRQGKIS